MDKLNIETQSPSADGEPGYTMNQTEATLDNAQSLYSMAIIQSGSNPNNHDDADYWSMALSSLAGALALGIVKMGQESLAHNLDATLKLVRELAGVYQEIEYPTEEIVQ